MKSQIAAEYKQEKIKVTLSEFLLWIKEAQ